jgi:phosphatidylglycerol:prolipoprotein diacylglycerol transferase
MVIYPDINPVAIQIGPLVIYWYGIMYLIGFVGAFWLCWSRRNINQSIPWTADDLVNLFFYGAIGVIFGGTWGELLFYEPHTLVENPIRLLQFWERGRSFHGGLLGVIIAILIYCYYSQRHFWEVMDFVVPAVPIGLATGRLGNFINGELWGRITEVPWAMVFPHTGEYPRHPSQLYEFALEGVLLFIILFLYSKKPRPPGAVSGLFLVCYGLFRSFIEFFREPEMGHDFVAFGWITIGQLLSMPMILVGLFILFYAYHYRSSNVALLRKRS